MAKTIVQIELDRPAGPYYPGDVAHATITMQNEKELTVRGASAYLAMREEYQYRRTGAKGRTYTYTETDESLHGSENLESEGIIPAGLHYYSASLRIPEDAVPGFAGKITKNAWLVKAKFDCPKAFDPEAQVEVPLVVPPPGLKVEPGDHGQERSEEVDLRLWLPRLEWVEGETLEGKVLVRPQAAFSVTEVRLELLLTEFVPRANGKTHSRSEGKIKLADKVEFASGQTIEYPFVLATTMLDLPTRSTAHSTATWSLKATLARRLKRDTEITVDIEVYNGAARH